jgi:hypothetical protein
LTTKEQDEDQQRQPEDCTQNYIPITTQKPSSPISNTTSQPQP